MTRSAPGGSAPGTFRTRIRGGSMWPLLPSGTVLEAVPLRGRLPSPGDVVLGVRDRRVVAHRVVHVGDAPGGPVVHTRGDANLHEDPPWRPEDLLGVARAAVVCGIPAPLDGPASTLGAALARHPRAIGLLARLARPAARAGRAAALAATLAATRIGLLRVAVAPLGPRDRDDLLDLVFAAGVDLGLPGDPAGPEPPAAALRNGEILGARISGVLAAAAGPGRALGRPDAARPVLAVHPLARGSVERALVDACRARGLPPPAPLRPLAPWHRAACRWVGAEVADE